MQIKFDTEGVANCPMNEVATIEECLACNYHKESNGQDTCIYDQVFPEPEEAYDTIGVSQ